MPGAGVAVDRQAEGRFAAAGDGERVDKEILAMEQIIEAYDVKWESCWCRLAGVTRDGPLRIDSRCNMEARKRMKDQKPNNTLETTPGGRVSTALRWHSCCVRSPRASSARLCHWPGVSHLLR